MDERHVCSCEWLPDQKETTARCLVLNRRAHSFLHLTNKDSENLHPLHVYDKSNSTRMDIHSSEERWEGSEAVT